MTFLLMRRLQQIWPALALALLATCSTARATETLTFIHTDIAGSPWAATDSGGNVVWREGYRPYGERTKNQPAAVANRSFFHGEAFDADSGLTYFGARYYDAAVGRFMGADPRGFDERYLHSFNRYTYGNNNPYKYKDPDGRFSYVYLIGLATLTGVSLYVVATYKPQGLPGYGSKDRLDVGPSVIYNENSGKGDKSATDATTNSTNGPGDQPRVRGLPPEGIAPPVDNPAGLKEGPASRPSEQQKGGKSLWDDKGGEWRYFPEDKHHNQHWDYNPHDRPASPWQNIPIGDLPPSKGGA